MTRPTSILLAAALIIGAPHLIAQSGSDLFQKALSKERVDGQLSEAIQIYAAIVKDFASDRPLAAKALLQMARCYERLGKNEASQTYERIVREYADQRPVAGEARDRLAQLNRTPGSSTGPSARLVWSGGGSGIDTRGSPSADGRYLSHVDYGDNPSGDLAVRDLTTGQSRRLTQGDSARPGAEFAEFSVFAPDGKQIAYSWFNKDGFRELRVTRIDRPRFRTVYRNPELGYLEPAAWTPDGKTIVTLLEGQDGIVQIALVSAADGTRRVLKTLDWQWPGGLSVSPDGRFIAYAATTDLRSPKAAVESTLTHDIFLLAVDGSREVPLVEHAADDDMPLWTADGAGVVFTSDRAGSRDAWFVAVTDGRAHEPARVVKRNLGRGHSMGLTRDGALFYAVASQGQDVHVGSVDPVSGRATAGPAISERFVGLNYGPDWSRDGTRLAYFSRRGNGPGSSTIVVRSPGDGLEHELVPRLQYFHRPRWRPDGMALVASGRGIRGPNGLFTIDAKTGAVETLVVASAEAGASHQAWSPDGRTLYYTSTQRVVARDMATGDMRTLVEDGTANEKAVSPDGTWLAFQRNYIGDGGESSVRLVPTAGGPTRVLLTLRAPEMVFFFGGLNWTPDGQRLFFVKRTGDTRELWQVHVPSGKSEPTGFAPPGLSYVRLHPDGRQLAYTAGTRQEEVWVIEHFLPPAQTRPPTSRRERER